MSAVLCESARLGASRWLDLRNDDYWQSMIQRSQLLVEPRRIKQSFSFLDFLYDMKGCIETFLKKSWTSALACTIIFNAWKDFFS